MTNILDRIVGRAEGLQIKYYNALAKIDLEIAHLGDIKARDYTAAKITGAKTELTSTEANASAGLKLYADREYLVGLVQASDRALILASEECDKIIGRRTIEVPRCTSTGREGAIDWHDADCWDAPIRGPLCAKHYQRERRWRIEHNLPTREIEAA